MYQHDSRSLWVCNVSDAITSDISYLWSCPSHQLYQFLTLDLKCECIVAQNTIFCFNFGQCVSNHCRNCWFLCRKVAFIMWTLYGHIMCKFYKLFVHSFLHPIYSSNYPQSLHSKFFSGASFVIFYVPLGLISCCHLSMIPVVLVRM